MTDYRPLPSEHDLDSCRVCGQSQGFAAHEAMEMMFGSRERFTYLECEICGCLQIAPVPTSLTSYYPNGYYSLVNTATDKSSALERRVRRRRTAAMLVAPPAVAALLTRGQHPPAWVRWLAGRASPSSEILDFGCGSGSLLLELHHQGFTRLTGYDPFIAHDVHHRDDLTVWRELQEDWDGSFDVVMLHHSLEPVPQPVETLALCRRLLRPRGALVLRTPVTDSFAWRTYGVDWVQLDAPRHLVLHSRASLRILAERTGFRTVSDWCDSTGFQFWGSEQYRRGIPLRDPRSFAEDPERSMFSKEEIERFERRAEELNAQGDGDQIVVILEAA